LAEYLRLTDKMRSAMGIKTIGSIDVNSKQRARRRKEQNCMHNHDKRRRQGAKPRAEYEAGSLSRTKPWEKRRISRRTWFRQRKLEKMAAELGTSPSAITPTPKPRALGTNPRSLGTNPRALGTNPRAKVRKAAASGPAPTGMAQVRQQSTVSGLLTDQCHASRKKDANQSLPGTAGTDALRLGRERHVPCGTNETADGVVPRGKIPWTTPELVEIQVTPEERAALERSPVYVAPSEIGGLVPEEPLPTLAWGEPMPWLMPGGGCENEPT
jgi:hypothetical protein